MNDETRKTIQELIFYYHHHDMEKFVRGEDERLKGFVIDDFTKLLELLRPVVFKASNE